MTEAFKRLNLRNEALMQEKAKLRERLQKMESKGNTRQDVQTQTDIQGFPSQIKMDEIGVQSPLNVKKSSVSDEDGKDISNSLYGCHFAKK